MIRLICFDIDDTLLDFHAGERIAFMESMKEMGLTCSEDDYALYETINESYWKALERGEVSKEDLKVLRFLDFFKQTNRSCDAKKMAEIYPRYLAEQCFVLPDAKRIVETIAKEYQLAAATNGISAVQRNRLAKSGMMESFSYLFISEEIGYAKPKKEFFDAVSRISGVGFDEMLMIGDSLSADISGAMQSHIFSVWYNPHHQVNHSQIQANREIDDLNQLFDILEELK